MGRALCIWLENEEEGCAGIELEAVKGHAEEDKAT
jgi:hypothetical protein